MSTQPAPKKRRLGEILMDAGLIDELQLKAALSEQKKWGGKLGRTLVDMGFLDEESMVLALSRQLGVGAVDLDRMVLPDSVVQLIRLDIAERYNVFPIGGDVGQKVLNLAMADPTNLDAIRELSFQTGMKIHASVAGTTAIEKAIRRYYYGERVVASDTITPQQLGVKETTFELQRIVTNPSMNAVSSAAPAAGPSVQELEKRIAALGDRLSLLEKHSANQVRALRALFDVLVEKKLVTREEYQAKVRKP